MPGSVPQGYRNRRPWRLTALIGVAAIALLLVAIASVVPLSSETARIRLIAALSDRVDGEVELRELHVRVLPGLHAEGRGLTVRYRGRHDVPPLISIERFTASGSVVALLRRHILAMTLEGLDIEIPPDRNRHADSRDRTGDRPRDPRDAPPRPHDSDRSLVIDELSSTGARLAIIPAETDRAPKVWDIHDLHMRSVSIDRAMPFEATLTNAVPPGQIGTRGTFGPWQTDGPGQTPLGGTFTFDRADLGVFKGLSGILAAHGSFGGVLARIDVHGETDTPRFTIEAAGHSVPLHTVYHAIVDGTNGNTLLERVDASFLNTSVTAKGGVIGTPGKNGRTITLAVTIDRGRLEDVLTLAVKSPKPPMTGALQMTTKFVLPPGDDDVVKKLRLGGRFTIAKTRFTSLDVQSKINELSHRARGDTRTPPDKQDVTSRFSGTFRLGGARLTIPQVTFDVPGSVVRLAGTYDLVPETLNFNGTLLMDVKVSQTTQGIKRQMLRIADPIFREKGGGSAIPIKIRGNRTNPTFGLDRGRVFRRE